MPNKEFLEDAPLYKKVVVKGLVAYALDQLEKVPLNMACSVCGSNQTFRMTNDYWEFKEPATNPVGRRILRLIYKCMHCGEHTRYFYVWIDDAKRTLMKVGQFPAWDISGDKQLEGRLGEHSQYYRRGLVCESQGYGIAAFSYYRRIVEEIIDALLDDVSNLLAGQELERYKAALEATKKLVSHKRRSHS